MTDSLMHTVNRDVDPEPALNLPLVEVPPLLESLEDDSSSLRTRTPYENAGRHIHYAHYMEFLKAKNRVSLCVVYTSL